MGLRMLIDAEPDLRVAGEAETGTEAIERASTWEPTVVLMDIQLPGIDGITATARIRRAQDAPKVLILTTFERTDYLHDALRAGASGFLLKDAPPERMLAAIRSVAEGNADLSPAMTRVLLDSIGAHLPAGNDSLFGTLTEQETALLRHIASGAANAEIAESLGLTEATVKTYVSRLLGKIGARDRAHAVALAYQHGLPR